MLDNPVKKRIDDILALMQIGRSGTDKMEIAKNYWDEMGNGDPGKVHAKLFSETLKNLNIDNEYVSKNMMIEAMVSGNISACLALNGNHYYRAVGYLALQNILLTKV